MILGGYFGQVRRRRTIVTEAIFAKQIVSFGPACRAHCTMAFYPSCSEPSANRLKESNHWQLLFI